MTWLADHTAHAIANVALRVLSPRDALRVTAKVIAWCPLRPEAARHSLGVLEPWGTCLTRSIAVAARLRGASVALARLTDDRDLPFVAHAWVELEGRPIRSWDAQGAVIARLGDDSVVLR
jgi:hypothetical protein